MNLRESSPITFFEKISNLIIKKIPNFFNKKLEVEQDSKIFLDTKTISIKQAYFLSKKQKKEYIKKIEREQDVIQFIIDWNNNERAHLENNMPDENLKGQALLNSMYIATSSIQDSNGTYLDNQIRPLFKTLYNFNLIGKKIFRVEKHLMEELILTDCSKIDDEFLQLPYDTISLHYPFNNQIKIRNDFLEWVFITQKDFEESDGYNSDFELFCVTKNNIFYTETFKFEGGDIAKQIKEQASIKYRKSKLAIEENILLFSLITSTLLYLNSDNVDKSTILPKCSFSDKHTKLPMCSLGKNIVINKDIYNYSSNSDGANDRLIHILKWTVRGHFRRQVCGKDFADRKTIWIRPFIKGVEKYNEETICKPSLYTIK